MQRRAFMNAIGGAAALPLAGGPPPGLAARGDAPSPPPVGTKEGPVTKAWLNESNKVVDEEVAPQERFANPESGIQVLRLTSEPCVNHHIYPETPVSTPDGRRFIFARRKPLERTTTFWIADLGLLRVRQVTDEAGAAAPIITPDGRWFHYSVGHAIKRLNPETYERETVFVVPQKEFPVIGGVSTVDWSGTRFLTPARNAHGHYGLACIDIAAGEVRMVLSGPDLWNPHGQYSRNKDRKALIQINHGIELDSDGNLLRLVGEKGASLVVAGDDGSNPVTLSAGYSMTERVQGHQCWVGPKDEVITTLHRRTSVSSPWIQDRIVAVVPGQAPRIVATGQAFTHIHTTPDGEFWVSDSNRTADIFVGSVKTGKYRLFHRSGATFGSAQETHPHPFFLGDGKSVGWNSDVTGVSHIYCARIPERFLDGLRAG